MAMLDAVREVRIGDRIRGRRAKKELSQAALANLVGCSDVSILYWERGDIKTIASDKLVRLADALDIGVAELLGDEKSVRRTREKFLEELIGEAESAAAEGAVPAEVVEWLSRWAEGVGR